jgi:hypothetical protein
MRGTQTSGNGSLMALLCCLYSLKPPLAPKSSLRLINFIPTPQFSSVIMAPYMKNNPRRSSRIRNLPAVSYSDARSYTRSGVIKKTPAKKAANKKAPVKQTPVKKTPAKKIPAKKTPAKKSLQNLKARSSSSSSASIDYLDDEESEEDVIPATPTKQTSAKKNSPKTVKQESASSGLIMKSLKTVVSPALEPRKAHSRK